MRYLPKNQTVLALETSCDESAVAVLTIEPLNGMQLMANCIASQVDEHAKWGGVVPEIASRRHLESLPFLVEKALFDSGLSIGDIDTIAATVAPGLAGSLLIGSLTGRTLAALHDLPFLGIHHLEGHLASVTLSANSPKPPFLLLLVSGGHTELIEVVDFGKYKRIGRSHDDAAGEAFDKVARLLGLPYPGGPSIEKISRDGDPKRFKLPKGRVSRPEGGFYPYDFSFSGLKTAMLRLTQSLEKSSDFFPKEDLAASFEQVVAEVLVERSLKCAEDLKMETLVMVGGVAANKRLRKMMSQRCLEKGVNLHLASKDFCTDNAAMIAAAALIRIQSEVEPSSMKLGVAPRWRLEQANLLYGPNPPF